MNSRKWGKSQLATTACRFHAAFLPAGPALAGVVVFETKPACGGRHSFGIRSFAIARVRLFVVRVCVLQTQRVRQVSRRSYSRQYMRDIPAATRMDHRAQRTRMHDHRQGLRVLLLSARFT